MTIADNKVPPNPEQGKAPEKCCFKECDAQGTPSFGFDFFMCDECAAARRSWREYYSEICGKELGHE